MTWSTSTATSSSKAPPTATSSSISTAVSSSSPSSRISKSSPIGRVLVGHELSAYLTGRFMHESLAMACGMQQLPTINTLELKIQAYLPVKRLGAAISLNLSCRSGCTQLKV